MCRILHLLHTTAGGEQPDQLMQVMLPLIDNEICNQPNWYNSSVDDSMVCAGYAQGRLGNCQVSFFIIISSPGRVRTIAISVSARLCATVPS